jgi:acetylglutamate/LysW-gamma-L-alpha-aminoadipate kinase
LYIIKIGGGATINVEGIVADLAELDEPALIVLGANAVRDKLAERLGNPKQLLTSISGYESVFSDETAIDMIMMSYAGLRSKRVVELCQRSGLNAIGLSGIDGRVVQGQRNKGIRVRENGKNLIKRDFSGKPRSANGDLLRWLLKNDYIPVITIPIVDESGFAINSENDDIVNVLQAEINAKQIFQFIEAPGYLDDKDDESTVIKSLSVSELQEREASAEGRIKRKLLALTRLFASGAARVIIADGRTEHPLNDALAGQGTMIN